MIRKSEVIGDEILCVERGAVDKGCNNLLSALSANRDEIHTFISRFFPSKKFGEINGGE